MTSVSLLNAEFQLIFAKVHCSINKLKSKKKIGARQAAAYLIKFKVAKAIILTKFNMSSILNKGNLWEASLLFEEMHKVSEACRR